MALAKVNGDGSVMLIVGNASPTAVLSKIPKGIVHIVTGKERDEAWTCKVHVKTRRHPERLKKMEDRNYRPY